MNKGRIEDQGPPKRIYERPATLFTATFMGESTLLSGKVLDLGMDEIRIDTQVGLLSLAGAGEPGFDVSLAIRARAHHAGIRVRFGLVGRGDSGRRRVPGKLRARHGPVGKGSRP